MPSLRRLTRGLSAMRRAVLLRRRALAALLTAVAVLAGLRAVSPPPTPTTAVLTAARDLPSGLVLQPEDLVARPFTPELVPAGVARAPVGRTLAAPLARGEPVTDVRLVGPSMLAGYPGLTAVPVRLPDAATVALLRVGDEVDLVAADPETGKARRLGSGLPVLALPPSTTRSGDASLPGALVMLGVTADQGTAIAGAAVREYLTISLSD